MNHMEQKIKELNHRGRSLFNPYIYRRFTYEQI
jgi:hypothetical protein